MRDITLSSKKPEKKTVIALGLFDGVHIGHQLVINTAKQTAGDTMKTAVFSFKTDTVTSKGHDGRIEMILSDEQKHQHFEKLGVDYIFSPDFQEYKNMPAQIFIKECLVNRLNCAVAVCGKDFRFGRGALGNGELLAEVGKEYGIKVIIANEVMSGDEIVSSSRIRKLIRNGDIKTANKLLGYEFGFDLPVEHGKALGRTLDFPTINQVIPKGRVLPRFGVYCSRVVVHGKVYNGVTNVGIKPTVKVKTSPLAETYIIGYEGNLYGEKIEIFLDDFVRLETKFATIEELKNQIARDTQYTIKYYSDKSNLK